MNTKKYIVLRSDRLQYAGTLNEIGAPESTVMSTHPSGETLSSEIEELSRSDVLDAVRNPGVRTIAPPLSTRLTDPVPTSELAVPAASQGSAWGVRAVGALESDYDGSGVTIAVLDTGIDLGHAAFSNRNLNNTEMMDFTAEDESGGEGDGDFHGHGTHVAGTIFGQDVNGTRIGVARGIRRALIGKVLNRNGTGTTAAMCDAILWAQRSGADIISMSLGIDFPGAVARLIRQGVPESLATSRVLEAYRANLRLFDAIAENLRARAMLDGSTGLVVAAAGNESKRDRDPDWEITVAPPAAADGFVSVGAIGMTTDEQRPYAVASFSNTGSGVVAPGVAVLSAKAGTSDELVALNGTSMATPHAAGVAALWSQRLTGEHGDARQSSLLGRFLGGTHRLPGLDPLDIGLGLTRASRNERVNARHRTN